MYNLTTFHLFIFSLLFLTGIILYYIFNRRKRRNPYYVKEEVSWSSLKPEQMQKIAYTVFLIGDAGSPSLINKEPTLSLLQSQLEMASERSSIFFLGDNIYPKGMPKPTDPKHAIAERRLLEQLKTVTNFKGRVVFISGNHDWNKGRKGGFDAVMRQQSYIDAYFGRKDVYLPRDGCPGPVELSVSDFLTIIVINTQWWVHGGKKPIGKADGCSAENEHDFFVQMKALLEKNKQKKILVIGHHPMYSKAYHGGKFDMKQHLFPLTDLNKRMYFPLPILGSIYPMYRKYIGSKEDMSHPKYKNIKKRLTDIFKAYDHLIYAAGHDHNLQYIRKFNQHYIVSGAGCKVTYVQKGSGAHFTHAHKGFFRLDYYEDGDVWLEAWEPSTNKEGILAYRKELMNSHVEFPEEENGHDPDDNDAQGLST
jgi:hypothetical protein